MLSPLHLVVVVLSCLFFCADSIRAASVLHKRQNDAKTVTTVQVINTPQGPMTQTCIITLTPITDSSGKPAVQEVEHCDLTPGTPQSSASGSPASTPTTPPQAPSGSNNSPTSSPSAAPVTSTIHTPDIPTNTVAGSSNATGSPSSSASDTSSSAGSKFQMPGKNLSVLPIGLGVFAGILVIAFIVVGLVTYERTKYRKAFRQRRLAEMGADMGKATGD